MSIKFGLIGGGVMGEALLSRLIAREIYQPEEVIVSEPLPARQSYLQEKYKVTVTTENTLVFTEAKQVIFLAVKPQIFTAIAQELANFITIQISPLIISILAGVSLSQLESAFPQLPIIRAMPNTPATVGSGITAICSGAYTNTKHQQLAHQIFASVGEVVEVSEMLMDAVTGLSGSGPAYVALMVESLADGGVAAGLPRSIANQLALQTVLGTAKLLQENKIHPAELKDRVTSPGGTTIAGVAQLERSGFRSAVIEAVKAATLRSQELGN
ncbi:pyrroline-5-carboxylate reductase [Chrysosporum bergii ANA360D]|uniref:Pyrroline-5-carboxylate reductase n=1 Tax=Chrysosporum bergii ANA360D TaxID=617107 RepID=A0AA43GS98_9CYAN|nr:pyrroline-5-carboxylate reductase [Chrysosporum bergii]MDH6059957.1 pyrroline-5-carboxylate reductase [Chrysosporum bergii ANA360D]